MIIYCGYCFGKKQQEARSRGMGMMISTCPGWKPDKTLRGMPCALDNGAFSLSRRGFPFLEQPFFDRLMQCNAAGLTLDFIVTPDLVAQGIESLKFSHHWSTQTWLASAPCKALAVQDGMTPDVVKGYDKPFSHIFVGGSVNWKWATAESWVAFAHSRGKRCHIGQAGRPDAVARCRAIGADSCDSTSFARNSTFSHADSSIQLDMFDDAIARRVEP